jgi:two-component sensor histidine kinase
MLHPEDRERVVAALQFAVEKRLPFEAEYRIVRPVDQQLRWIHSVGEVVRHPATQALRLIGISRDITERRRDQERERLLTREVDHRAKNLLGVIQSVLHLTRAETKDAFIQEVSGRIEALGRVHSLIAASRWQGAELSSMIREEFAPFAEDGDRLTLSGPRVQLKPAAAQSIALVLHELTINAAKYGALSTTTGQVTVAWEVGTAPDGQLVLRWCERGGARVGAPPHHGFWSEFFSCSGEGPRGGHLRVNLSEEGLECEIAIPARQLVRDD